MRDTERAAELRQSQGGGERNQREIGFSQLQCRVVDGLRKGGRRAQERRQENTRQADGELRCHIGS
jgi:hypothetical protein